MSKRGLRFRNALGAGDAHEADGQRREAEDAAESAFAARAAEIRTRIREGVYDDPTLAEEVARRLLATGDLGVDASPLSPGQSRKQGGLGL